MAEPANIARLVPDKFLVAISFAGEQRELVRGIAEAVEKRLGRGTVFYDQWFEHYLAGGSGDLKLQEIYGRRSILVVVCVSERYGGKPWPQTEWDAVRERQMKSRSSQDKRERESILPIRVGDGEVEGILFNAIVPDVRSRSATDSATLIINRLLLIAPEFVPDTETPGTGGTIDWPEAPPQISWPMADHNTVREAFASLLTRTSPWRYLPLRGAGETGKSLITQLMLANALAMPNVACGRFDFKGTSGMESEVAAFAQFLEVPAPPSSSKLHDRLGHILASLKQRPKATALIFDTYEVAGETQDWIGKQLLPNLIRAPWLRVAIAGQKVPDPTVAIWTAVAFPTLHLATPPAKDWFEYGKQHRPGLTLKEVKTACKLAEQKATLLAQLLGPKK
jgi:hypothetical protein